MDFRDAEQGPGVLPALALVWSHLRTAFATAFGTRFAGSVVQLLLSSELFELALANQSRLPRHMSSLALLARKLAPFTAL